MAKQDVWRLENFLDSLILELDKAQDTLSLKGMNRKLTYTVKDVGMDLFVFPQYQDGRVVFANAQPGDQGASKISFQLGSITDKQIRETTRKPIEKDDIAIDNVDGLDEDVKDSLKKIGVSSTRDLETLEQRNVDVEKVVADKATKTIDYAEMANLIRKARRQRNAPVVNRIRSMQRGDAIELSLMGKNLVDPSSGASYPLGLINNQKVDVAKAADDSVVLVFPQSLVRHGENVLTLELDPYAVLNMSLNHGG